MSAWPLIIKGKPLETAGRKARELKRAPRVMPAQPLIMISKPPEMTGRKAMGANVSTTMPARPPDTLHPSKFAKKGRYV